METLYCVKCRAKREVQETERVVFKNNRSAVRARCPVCGTVMTKFVKHEPAGENQTIKTPDSDSTD